ncbi:Inositol-1-monophosphatase [Pedobacter sp. Bi27]|uniref:inositol monophosphatase family protein n=1 Tax=unclassified Pedobacter TaxID=2628915 RepID=UPI001DE335B5|nr:MULTISPECIES: inositol monophosphatase family protein [unclassified Pedobacter]CAH0124787.1 Inositol-1-monophosphatase [Pedobacter sp. Bi36]CAH0177894.1 Inositol-1-monophosphatase [Pedobacter sp. Bi126]CAH0283306.1 Inositol-1-monophosphatase [Pedobacter sp. Bi27]
MNYELLCTKVISIVRLTGNFIRKEAMQFDVQKIEYKGLNDMVSYVDKTAEQKLVQNLEKLIPDAGFITEEKTINRTGKTYTWIIDPLDGTTNFIHGIPAYGISVALYEDGLAVIGVVYELNRGEMFYSYKGGPALMNKKEIKVSTNPDLKSSLLATGFPYYQFDKQPQYLKLLTEMMQKSHGVRRIGAAAIDLVYTACGRFDAFFEYNLQQWDFAAGCFIVQQAGGEVYDFSGGNNYFEKREILATNGKLTAEMLTAIKQYF